MWRLEVPDQGLVRSVSDEGSLLGLLQGSLVAPTHFLLCSHKGERERESSVFAYKDTNPIGSEPHPYDTFNLNFFLTQNTAILRVRASTYRFGG